MRGKKIIIAEASSTIKSVADSLLRQEGYDVVCTSDGLQAWEVIQAERPDLALIGLNLSGISGLELCRQMSGDKIAGGIPAMLLIGAKDKVTSDQLAATGARGHLKKPFSPKDLLAAVARMIGSVDEPAAARSELGAKNKTSYKSEILSGTNHQEKDPEQAQNVNWADIEIAGNAARGKPKKIASLNIGSANEGLIIEEDQFGLTNRDYQKDAYATDENIPADDEDYNWFVGEMKKEVEGQEKDVAKASKEGKHRPTLSPNLASEDELRFDDLSTERQDSGISGVAELDMISIPAGENVDLGLSKTALTDNDIDRLAGKIAEKLASSIAGRIDKKTLIDAIKSSLTP